MAVAPAKHALVQAELLHFWSQPRSLPQVSPVPASLPGAPSIASPRASEPPSAGGGTDDDDEQARKSAVETSVAAANPAAANAPGLVLLGSTFTVISARRLSRQWVIEPEGVTTKWKVGSAAPVM